MQCRRKTVISRKTLARPNYIPEHKIYKDASSGKMILVDGILGTLFYVFDRVADKTCVLDTLSGEFFLEQLKNSRSNFYQAFQLQYTKGNIQEKRKISTIFLDL